MRASATRPPEARGIARDGVRLLAATPDGLQHAIFSDLPRYLRPGDLLVVNTSATIAAALDGRREDGRPVTVNFSTALDDATWLTELRTSAPDHGRVLDVCPGELIRLSGGLSVTMMCQHPGSNRMWLTSLDWPDDVLSALARYGRPIRYSHVPDPWPISDYQTVFSRDPGSAEMPSAGRPFTGELVTRLITRGVSFAPITLHAGVASLETGEPPLPERFTVSEQTARLINLTREAGGRVVAVGTTCTRAVESATDEAGTVRASAGWTELVLGQDHPARAVNGLITGWHDPEASHLALLQAVAGAELVKAAYAEAEQAGYLWHEFGDSAILLPPG